MELTGQRRRPATGFSHRSTLTSRTQASSCGEGRTLSPLPASVGARQSPAPTSGGSRSAGLPSPGDTGDTPLLLRQHSAPAGPGPRPAVGRIARSNSGNSPSGPFKRPVKQRLSPFGRGPPVAPPRDGELRGAQVAPPREGERRDARVAPPREGEIGQGLRRTHSPAGDAATGPHRQQLKPWEREQRPTRDSADRRQSERRNDRLIGVSYTAKVAERRHYSSGVYREIANVKEHSMKMGIAAGTKSNYGGQNQKEKAYADGNGYCVRQKPTDLENCVTNSANDDIRSDKRSSWNVRHEMHSSGVIDKFSGMYHKIAAERGDENKNYIFEKRTAHVEGNKFNQAVSHFEIERSAPGEAVKRGHISAPGERVPKKPRIAESSYNSPDQSFSFSGVPAPGNFPERSRKNTVAGWGTAKRAHVSQGSSYFASQSYHHRRRERMIFDRRMGPLPPTHRMAFPPHCQGERFGPQRPPFERAGRRPPLLPTPPSRFLSGGSPPVTTTTGPGEAPALPIQPDTVAPLGLHWATGMPLLPQFLEPLSPMSPLSISSPPSPALPLSPLSPLSPQGPLSPPAHGPPDFRRDLSPRLPSPQPPQHPPDRSRSAAAPNLTSNTDRPPDSDSDSDFDSDSHDSRVACRTHTSYPAPKSQTRSHDARRYRFDSIRTADGRVDRERGGEPRPSHSAIRSSKSTSTAASPPDRGRAERRQRTPTSHTDRLERERARSGRCGRESRADERADRDSSPRFSSRHRGDTGHADPSHPRSALTDGQQDGMDQVRDPCDPPTGGTNPHGHQTTCGCEDHTDAGGGGSPGCDSCPGLSPNGGQTDPGTRDLSIFTAEYLSELLQLQRRIMTSRDSGEMARVLALLWETGQVRDTALYYDFDLCALDQGVVRQLQKCLS